MARGDLTASERAELDKVIRAAEQASRVEFSVFRGVSDGDPKAFARSLHAALSAPDRSVLVMVDPLARVVEVVTGAEVRRTLTDAEAHLAVMAMQTAFAEGDEVGGLKRGINLLAEHARAPQSNHTS
ncbi:DUF5130 family protein [Nocardioides daphniae]|uniref:DUF5130 family protein n=1 Tax=Nocardioides daphniae TaxID=402297 RepID=A0A4P7U9S2_9ACTN|nr:DUF5130 family protein [Nocardioides daphniae]QCC76790.1 DUF5130 family protein [Nocardioides daphniae]GGD16536.1 hypothetical protein GCM10007231_14340 [Nocardioides daphniae]